MNIAQAGEPAPRKPLRLWPAVVVAIIQLLAWFVPLIFVHEAVMYGIIAGVFGGLLIAVWWLFFSRAPWSERIGAIVLMIVALLATKPIVHKSVANAGMGMMLPILAIPVLGLALVCWAVASRRLSSGPRRASLVAAILLGCGVFTVVRTGGVSGEGTSDLHWRWTKTPEERLLAQAGSLPLAPPAAPVPARTTATIPGDDRPVARRAEVQPVALLPSRVTAGTAAAWSGFRGPGRDSIIPGTRIRTDWSTSPPAELWRRPIGPGWSSFAVRGDLLYTQEQRGDDELVTCYNATTGQPVWAHRDAARFWESNGGAGPRATPTLHDGRVYTFGATGILNALDADNGAVVWTRNAASDTGAKLPIWGFSSSPLVVDDMVIVATAGRLAAYDLATGGPRWVHREGGGSYSSPHLLTIGGVVQVVLLSSAGATSVAPADGSVLWKHSWPGGAILQPALTADGGLLISANDSMGGIGTRRLAVAHGPAGWTAEEAWTSTGLKPYFNDFVVHDGHVFGFDGGILACIDAKDGKRKWKGGRYGHGQLLLLRDQNLLLVLSEEGELALVKAASDQFTELARHKAMDDKTWNHPVLVGDRLLVRNGAEMVAFRLPVASR